jgi:hypothetical protein
MPRVGIEPTTPALERVKTVHALDSAATVIEFTPSLNTDNYLPNYRQTENSSFTIPLLRQTE